MRRGKDICKILKEIRRRIAMENDIELITSECRHKGSCAGTCPKCEAEVAYLESQLADRKRLGKVVKLVGLSMGLAALPPVTFTSCNPRDGDVVELQGDIAPAQLNDQEPNKIGDNVAIAPDHDLE